MTILGKSVAVCETCGARKEADYGYDKHLNVAVVDNMIIDPWRATHADYNFRLLNGLLESRRKHRHSVRPATHRSNGFDDID